MTEQSQMLGSATWMLKNITVPKSATLALLASLAAAQYPQVAHAWEHIQKGDKVYECLKIVNQRPTEPGVYILRGSSPADSKSGKRYAPWRILVIEQSKGKSKADTKNLTQEDMQRVVEIDDMLCRKEPVSAEPTPEQGDKLLPVLPGHKDATDQPAGEGQKDGTELKLPPRPKDLPVYQPKKK